MNALFAKSQSFKRQITRELTRVYKGLTREIAAGNLYHTFRVQVLFTNNERDTFYFSGKNQFVKLRDAEEGMQVCCRELDIAVAAVLTETRVPKSVFVSSQNLVSMYLARGRRPLEVAFVGGMIETVTESRNAAQARRDIIEFQKTKIPSGQHIERVL